MNAVITCKCGTRFTIALAQAGTQVTCTGCGKRAIAPMPKSESLHPSAASKIPQMEIGEAETQAPPASPLPASMPPPIPERIDEVEEIVDDVDLIDDSDGYGLDANDGLAHLHEAGVGMWGTVAVIRLDVLAPCIAYGCKGAWALAGQESDVQLVNMKDHKRGKVFEKHDADVTAVALAASDSLAASGDADGEVLIWDAVTRKVQATFEAHSGEVHSVAITFDGKRAASGGEDGLIRLWDLSTGKRVKLEFGDWSDDDEQATYVAFSRDGTKLLAGGDEGRVCIWDALTGKRIKKYSRLELPISCVRLSDEGGYITATTFPVRHDGGSFLLLNRRETGTGDDVNEIPLSVNSIPCCVAPDQIGKRVLIGGGGEFPWLCAFQLDNGRLLHVYDALRGAPICLAVAPHNNRVIASLNTGRLQVFGMTTS